MAEWAAAFGTEVPSVLLALLVIVLDTLPYGIIMLPPGFPAHIGVVMLFRSALAGQLVYLLGSSFDAGLSSMMVENLPFVHAFANEVLKDFGGNYAAALPTVLAGLILSTLLVALLFWALGIFGLGSAAQFFPKPVLCGCVGGIGVFLVTTGLSVSSDLEWSLDGATLSSYFASGIWPLWVSAAALGAALRVLVQFIQSPLLPPLFFLAIPAAFWAVLAAGGFSVDEARASGWLFDPAAMGFDGVEDSQAVWPEVFDGAAPVRWESIASQTHTLLGLVVFSLIHVPINVPALAVATGQAADLNAEMAVHGWSNFLAALVGAPMNYLCFSASALFAKCNGCQILPPVVARCEMLRDPDGCNGMVPPLALTARGKAGNADRPTVHEAQQIGTPLLGPQGRVRRCGPAADDASSLTLGGYGTMAEVPIRHLLTSPLRMPTPQAAEPSRLACSVWTSPRSDAARPQSPLSPLALPATAALPDAGSEAASKSSAAAAELEPDAAASKADAAPAHPAHPADRAAFDSLATPCARVAVRASAAPSDALLGTTYQRIRPRYVDTVRSFAGMGTRGAPLRRPADPACCRCGRAAGAPSSASSGAAGRGCLPRGVSRRLAVCWTFPTTCRGLARRVVGRVSSILALAGAFGCMLIGGTAVAGLPRMLAGCVMLHIGGDLVFDGLVEPWRRMDWGERITMWGIAVSMAVLGFEQGILVGIVLACFAFIAAAARAEVVRPMLPSAATPAAGRVVADDAAAATAADDAAAATAADDAAAATAASPAAAQPNQGATAPGTGPKPANTVLSSSAAALRGTAARLVLEREQWRRHGLVLQGTLFFGNAGRVAHEVERLCPPGSLTRRYLVVDCSLITSMDFSAAEVLADAFTEAAANRVTVALVGGPRLLATQIAERGAGCANLLGVACVPGSWEAAVAKPPQPEPGAAPTASPVAHPPIAALPDVDTALCYVEDVILRCHGPAAAQP
ncbi:hypothetical protein FNF29_00378 [Cafeteria roenbergensis]|uniref:STAS domain-containing protein n=1 Tax=Cafeteria roenbergensis TaxID=33653 RepID=A0A5A8DZP5_CAFRO|nr:hypothetical protein FNF29_00378 [Cafeteria roenbergensis]KAA0168862.1 hypothetical protein FNF31_00023 [Cafeteria roenbergensis]KAA0170608.1 hypothetical protein FNF28_01370 [Cafeteria roenbergensis]|eukprot:KAA0157026.1 hypothetical protein FNF29_00378 [Cafeteria roenbergensis]